jgi:hypothetical protein
MEQKYGKAPVVGRVAAGMAPVAWTVAGQPV